MFSSILLPPERIAFKSISITPIKSDRIEMIKSEVPRSIDDKPWILLLFILNIYKVSNRQKGATHPHK
jgi:hypothetical protein